MRNPIMRAASGLAIAALASILLASCTSTEEQAFSFELEPSLRTGPVTGYFQIPKGGKPGSTSLKRPTLKEMGVTWTEQLGLNLKGRMGRHDILLDARWLFLAGDGEAEGEFTSQNEYFSAGTGLESNSAVATWGLTYGYTFPLGDEETNEWELTPRVGFKGVTIQYRLDGDNGARTDRSFTHIVPALGMDLAYEPDQTNWSFMLRGHTTLSYLDRNVNITDLGLRAGYRFTELVDAWVELGYQHFYVQDYQDFPNQMNIDFGPTLGLGVNFTF